MFATRSNSSATQSADEWGEALNGLLASIRDEQGQLVNETEEPSKPATDSVQNMTGLQMDTLSNTTFGMIEDFYDLVNQNATFDELCDWAMQWAQNATTIGLWYNSTTGSLDQWTQRWFEDVESAVADNATSDELRDLFQDIYSNLTALVDEFRSNITASDFVGVANVTFENVTDLINAFLDDEGSFQRAVLQNAMEDFVTEAIRLVRGDTNLNISTLISSNFDVLDSISSSLGDYIPSQHLSNTLAIAQMVFVSSSLSNVSFSFRTFHAGA
jgi:hypothetical protein